MKRKKEVFWGVLLILGAVYVLANQMGFFYQISLFRVAFTIFLVGILVENLVQRSFGGILFSLAFLGILYDKQLGIEKLTPIPILVAALLGTIGLNMIFQKKNHLEMDLRIGEEHWGGIPEILDMEEEVHCRVSFNSTTKYVSSPCFRRAVLESSFGNMAVYFDQAVMQGDYAEVMVDVSFGNIEIYIPKEWKAELNVNTSFGTVKEVGGYSGVRKGKGLLIFGNASFGGVEVHYI